MAAAHLTRRCIDRSANSLPTWLCEPGDRRRLHPLHGRLQHLLARVDELHRCVFASRQTHSEQIWSRAANVAVRPAFASVSFFFHPAALFLRLPRFDRQSPACVAGFFSNSGGLCTRKFPARLNYSLNVGALSCEAHLPAVRNACQRAPLARIATRHRQRRAHSVRLAARPRRRAPPMRPSARASSAGPARMPTLAAVSPPASPLFHSPFAVS